MMHQYAPFSYEGGLCIVYFEENPIRFVFDLELGTGLHVVAIPDLLRDYHTSSLIDGNFHGLLVIKLPSKVKIFIMSTTETKA